MREQDEAAIRALEEAYDAAWNSGDVTSLVGAFTPDVVVVNPMGKRSQGVAEVGRMLEEFLRGRGKGSRHRSVVVGIEFIGDDVAVVDGEATLDGTTGMTGGSDTPFVHRFTDVAVKRAGVWRIAHVRAYFFRS